MIALYWILLKKTSEEMHQYLMKKRTIPHIHYPYLKVIKDELVI